MQKRGISELISWVLMIGFTVALAVIVTQFLREQAETTSENIVIDTEGDLRCSDVSLTAYCFTQDSIKIKNKGYFTIYEIRVRKNEELTSYPINLKPGQESETLNTGPGNLDIIPIIKVEDKLLACSDRKVSLTC